MSKKIFILGGDGFCGWPAALSLSKKGNEIIIIDNLSRRKIDIELGVNSLTPISTIEKRLISWQNVSGNKIKHYNIDIAREYDKYHQVVIKEKPDTIIHFAEQRAAPYSMKGQKEKRYTVANNINATNNVLCSIADSGLDIHLVHLGTMGVYGYGGSGMKLPEGYIDVDIPGVGVKEIVYPPSPGSIYHMTKTQDALLFQFYNKNDGIRITDLHQGIVWGTNTQETNCELSLINRFDYDGDYGTVLNRFLMQGAIGHPLTVHGSGGQTRAFIHIKDSVQCINIAVNEPPEVGEKVKIFNQMTECHKIIDLAKLISEMTGVEIQNLSNPRKEANENELLVENGNFLKLGLKPTFLEKGLMKEVSEVAARYENRCDRDKILCTSQWVKK